jgi:hypothetical protein
MTPADKGTLGGPVALALRFVWRLLPRRSCQSRASPTTAVRLPSTTLFHTATPDSITGVLGRGLRGHRRASALHSIAGRRSLPCSALRSAATRAPMAAVYESGLSVATVADRSPRPCVSD